MTPSAPRVGGFDVVRAAAMLLGVVYHATFAYVPEIGRWYLVQDVSTDAVFAAIGSVLHAGRMQAFFVLSGYFAHLIAQRGDVQAFITDRARRLLVPLVVAAPLVVAFDRAAQQWALQAGLLDAGYRGLTDSSVRPLYLWFLEYALLFSIACWPWVGLNNVSPMKPFGPSLWRPSFSMASQQARRTRERGTGSSDRPSELKYPELLLLLSALTAGAQLWLGEPTPAFSFVPQPASLAHFGPFFIVGWWLWGTRLDAFRRCWWLGPIGLALSCVVYSRPLQWQPLGIGLGSLSTWATVLGALSLAVRMTAPPPARIRWLVESSYWVYLAHYPVVVSLHLLLARQPWSAWPKFMLVITGAMAVSLATYALVIRRSFIGRWLTPSLGRTRP